MVEVCPCHTMSRKPSSGRIAGCPSIGYSTSCTVVSGAAASAPTVPIGCVLAGGADDVDGEVCGVEELATVVAGTAAFAVATPIGCVLAATAPG